MKTLNVRNILHYSLPQTLVFSDASHIGCGAWSAECGGLKFQQIWSEEEQGKSSTWRELCTGNTSILKDVEESNSENIHRYYWSRENHKEGQYE